MLAIRRVFTVLLATLMVAAQGAGAQVRVPHPLPRTSPLPGDPLDQPTPRCVVDSGAQYVRMDASQVAAPRKLVRSEPSAVGGAIRTRILALKPSSDFWVTRCPVRLQAQHLAVQGSLCRPATILDPGANGSMLRIARGGGVLRFKLDNTRLGTLKGRLEAVRNPHGAPEVTWLRGAEITANGRALDSHEFYVYLQDVNGYKSYLLEVFDLSDAQCLAAHRPGANTLCVNADTDDGCMRARMPSSTASGLGARSGERLDARVDAAGGSDGPGQQTDTGGGHEPVER